MTCLNAANATATVLLSVLLVAFMALFFPALGAVAAQGYEISSLMTSANPKQVQSPDAQAHIFAANVGLGLGELLREDGTLDLASGFHGTLDARGYRLVSGPSEAPRFELMSLTGDEGWAEEFTQRGMDDRVCALAVDASGNVYAGGYFWSAGGISANYIAKWSGSSWETLGSGMDDWVSALAVDASGNVYAGGGFTTAGGVSANRIAKWNGSSWEALGSGMGGGYPYVSTLAVDGSGNVYAGGDFTTAGGVSVSHIAKWDGSSWETLGSGMNDGVLALAVDGSGNVYAGGDFTAAGGVSASHIAKWNGSSWETLGSGMNDGVLALAVDASGNVYAGGRFSQAGGVSAEYIARWNGSSWEALGSGMNGGVLALAIDGSGNVYAGGYFTTSKGISAKYIARWNGFSWETLGSGMNGSVLALALYGSGNVYAGGDFKTVGGEVVNYIASWRTGAWSGVYVGIGNGVNLVVHALAINGSESVYAGGGGTTAGGVSANRIAKWNGSSWEALGNGMSGGVLALALDDSGNLYAGGGFTTAGGVSANRIAKWNGSSWEALGSGMGGYHPRVSALAVDGSGNVYAGGWFKTAGGVSASHIAKWNGSSWEALGSGMGGYYPLRVYALAADGSGNVYAGGNFTTAGGVSANYIAKWNGSSWEALGSGMNDCVLALALDGSGNLYAGGDFTTAGGVSANYIAKWNGSSWEALGSGMGGYHPYVSALAVDGSGSVYAGGRFSQAGGAPANDIAKWSGSSWETLGSGMNGRVYALAADGCGNLYAGGWFTKAGAKGSSHIARWTENSPSGHSLSGTVTIDGAGLSGATVSLAQLSASLGAGTTKSTKTDINGNYSFSCLSDGVYAIIPTKTGYSFTPASITAEVEGADVADQDFAVSFAASGKVTSGGSGLAGVTIKLSGAATKTTTTGSDGTYSFSGLVNGWYTVAPLEASPTFSPQYRSFNINGADVSGLDFAAVGSLKVILTPEGVVTAGARWKVDKGDWKKSGTTIENLDVRPHTIAFKAISGWVTPANQTVTIAAGETMVATGTYQTLGADFSGTPTSGKASLKVKFTDQSTGPVKIWLWDFGDSDTSTVQNPAHNYSTPGTYTVTLTVKNGNCTSQRMKTDYITVYPAPRAEFSAEPTSGKKPLTVQFNDQTTGPVTSWLWSFGDTGTSADQNPTHTFSKTGTYTVKLKVDGPGGTNTRTKTSYIKVQQ